MVVSRSIVQGLLLLFIAPRRPVLGNGSGQEIGVELLVELVVERVNMEAIVTLNRG